MKKLLTIIVCATVLLTQTLPMVKVAVAEEQQSNDQRVSVDGVIDDAEEKTTHVAFYGMNWELIEENVIEGNTIPTECIPQAPEIKGCEFVCWNKDINAQYEFGSDVKIYAIYRYFGDVNNDGNITDEDYYILNEYINDIKDDGKYEGDYVFSEKDLYFADCTRNGVLDDSDVEYIAILAHDIDYRNVCDTNNDRKINTADATEALKLVSGMIQSPKTEEKRFWDANFDKVLNTSDAVAILKYVTEHDV